MSRKPEILRIARTKRQLRTSDVVAALKISRQTAASYLSAMVREGTLRKTGATRTATYFLASKKSSPKPPASARLLKNLKNLQEDRVFSELTARLGLKGEVSKPVFGILSYAFTEMLNNAIDHSQSSKAKMDMVVSGQKVEFTVRDWGVGIFANIRKHFNLPTELEAYEWLLKGKQTTFPERHSGQGIFFTSKIADIFTIRSHRLKVVFDNEKKDIFLSETTALTGTSVSFSIRRQSRRKIEALFRAYSDQDYEFDKNVVRVKASIHEGLYSRSQARRLTAGLQNYRKIVFDFRGVKEMGQAFADEIFRVFRHQNPTIQLEYTGANEAAEFLIRRAME
jgi:anti-sigma regulatory factor (Ser/Thr protein kinase)